jgi:hypothetical protein
MKGAALTPLQPRNPIVEQPVPHHRDRDIPTQGPCWAKAQLAPKEIANTTNRDHVRREYLVVNSANTG